jgi:hypothetical protein
MEGLGAVIPDANRAGFLNYLTQNFGSPKGTASKPAGNKSGSAAK